MDFLTAVKTCFQKYFDFKGRARRSEFWYFVLFIALCGFVLGIVDLVVFKSGRTLEDGSFTITLQFFQIGYDGKFDEPLSDAFGLAILVPLVAAGIRRMHDIGKSGWFLALPALPPLLLWPFTLWMNFSAIAGILIVIVYMLLGIVVLIMLAHDEGPENNEFGPSPKYGAKNAEA